MNTEGNTLRHEINIWPNTSPHVKIKKDVGIIYKTERPRNDFQRRRRRSRYQNTDNETKMDKGSS